MFEKLIPEQESMFAKQHFSHYMAGDIGTILGELEPSLVNAETEAEIAKIIEYIPDGEPVDVQIVGSNTSISTSSRTVSLTIQYEFPEDWLVVSIVVDGSTDKLQIAGINTQLTPASLKEINAFRLGAHGVVGVAIVLAAIAVPIFCIYAFVLCLKTPIPKRKWGWAFLTLLGVVTLKINWTTGAWGVNLLSFQLLGSGVARHGLAGAWIISLAFPLGALIFLLRRKQWLNPPPTNESEFE